MIINGKYASAITETDELEYYAIEQIKLLCNQPFLEGEKVVIMVDCHPSVGSVVGFTSTFTNGKFCPSLIGGDLFCGMLVSKLKDKNIELASVDKTVREQIIERKKVDSIIEKYMSEINLNNLICKKYIDTNRVYNSCSTLGNGNHFIAIESNNKKEPYLIIHSGSRLLGNQIHEYYMDLAYRNQKKSNGQINRMFSYLEGDDLKAYLHDIEIAKLYASASRRGMAEIISKGIKNKFIDSFETIHNYVDMDDRIVRKGAISSKSEKVIIPISASAGSIICKSNGLNDENFNFSLNHGAGRCKSRGDAKNDLTVSQYRKDMQGIFSSSINESTLDEAPGAYKSKEFILRTVGNRIEVIEDIKPIYNFKNGLRD